MSRKNMFKNKDGEFLCESPDFGFRCDNIGINGKKGIYVCMKYPDQELLEDREGWVRSCEGCISGKNEYTYGGGIVFASTKYGRNVEEAIKSLQPSKATKTRIIARACKQWFHGYIDSKFIFYEQMCRKAFDQLVDLGFIKYVPRKPCVWVEDPTKRS